MRARTRHRSLERRAFGLPDDYRHQLSPAASKPPRVARAPFNFTRLVAISVCSSFQPSSTRTPPMPSTQPELSTGSITAARMNYPHFLIFPFSMEPNATATVMPVEGRGWDES
jgi:hypothetical protein